MATEIPEAEQPATTTSKSKCGKVTGPAGRVRAHEIRCHTCALKYAGR